LSKMHPEKISLPTRSLEATHNHNNLTTKLTGRPEVFGRTPKE
jgi:hypothetical protein